MGLLGDDSMSVIVHSLSLITALCLNEDLGNKVRHDFNFISIPGYLYHAVDLSVLTVGSLLII